MLNSKNFKNSLNFGLSQFFQLLITFVSFIVIARILGEDDFGSFSTAYNTSLLFISLSSFGLTELLPKEISRACQKPAYFFYNSLYLKTILALFCLVVLFGARPWLNLSPSTFRIVLLLWIHFYLFSLHALWVSYLIGLNHIREASLTITTGKFAEGILILFAYLIHPSLLGFCWAFVVGNIFRLVPALYYCRQYTELTLTKPNFSALFTIIKQALPFALITAFITLNGRLDVLILTGLTQERYVGVFYAVWRLIESTCIIPRTLLSVIYPQFSKAFNNDLKGLKRGIMQYTNAMIFVSVPTGVFVWACAPAIVKLIYGDLYSESIPVLAILGLTLPLIFLNSLFMTIMAAINLQHWTMAIYGVSVILCGASNFFLIPSFGVTGVAIAKIGVELFVFLTMLFFIVKSIGSPFNFRFLANTFFSSALIGFFLILTPNQFVLTSAAITGSCYLIMQYSLRSYPLMFSRD